MEIICILHARIQLVYIPTGPATSIELLPASPLAIRSFFTLPRLGQSILLEIKILPDWELLVRRGPRGRRPSVADFLTHLRSF